MKYKDYVYEEFEFYGGNEDESCHEQKIVKVRKDHECCNCHEVIKKGDNALYESCFMDGPQHAYTCITCCDNWIDESECYDEEDLR